MPLSAEQIKEAVSKGDIQINPFDEAMLKAGSYTFTLGNKFKKLNQKGFIDSREKQNTFEEFEIGENGYLLQPGEFIICHTKETLKLSKNVCCFLTMRGARAQTGLGALQGEIYCEPGSEGGLGRKIDARNNKSGSVSDKAICWNCSG